MRRHRHDKISTTKRATCSLPFCRRSYGVYPYTKHSEERRPDDGNGQKLTPLFSPITLVVVCDGSRRHAENRKCHKARSVAESLTFTLLFHLNSSLRTVPSPYLHRAFGFPKRESIHQNTPSASSASSWNCEEVNHKENSIEEGSIPTTTLWIIGNGKRDGTMTTTACNLTMMGRSSQRETMTDIRPR